MRLCVITNTVDIGGAETQLLRLCRRLPRLGVDVEVIYYGGAHALRAEFESAARLTYVSKSKLGRVRVVLELARRLRRARPDIVHCWVGTANQYGALAALLAHVPCILTGHRSVIAGERLRCWFDRAVAGATRGRVVNSNTIAATHERITGYPAHKLHVVHNGLDPEEFLDLPPPSNTLAALGLPGDRPLVSAVGRLAPEKGMDLFVELAVRVVCSGRNVSFIVAGDGPERGRLERLSSRAGLSEHLQFLGTRTDVPALLSASTVHVCTSPSEGLPNSILEAMMAGTPVVTVDNGGGPEVLGNPEQVIPVGDPAALADKVGAVLDDGQLRQRWSERQRERAVRDFSLEQAAEKYLGVLRTCWRD